MTWNWQQSDWPDFIYQANLLPSEEAKLVKNYGVFLGTYQYLDVTDQQNVTVDILCNEAVNTSAIEGEYLNRDSVRSSLLKQMGLKNKSHKVSPAEQGIAEMMLDAYKNYAAELSDDMLFNWHLMLTNGRYDLECIGRYRTQADAMQIVSGRPGKYKVHFEAPPAKKVNHEMKLFIKWFNNTAPNGSTPLSPLLRCALVHLYFVSIHPFEDGNGRIGRALSIKALSQSLEYPLLIALSDIIAKNKKEYYDMLEKNNRKLSIDSWLQYFAKTILAAQTYTQENLDFIIQKTKFFDRYNKLLNERQKKVIERIFRAGVEGFKGGLSAHNYITITQTSASTATRDLQELVDLGIFKKTGQLKSTRYEIVFS